MNILLINNNYPSIAQPNQATYIKSIKECLELAGITVELLVMFAQSNLWSKMLSYIRFYFKLLFFKYDEYDYVYINHFHSLALPLVANFKRMNKIIIHWHGEDLMGPTLFKRYINNKLNRFLNNSILHIVPSEYFSSILKSKLRIENIFVSASGGVDTNIFLSTNINRDPESIHLGFSSGLDRSKGLDLIVSLVNRLDYLKKKVNKKIILHYIDFGPDKNYFSRAIRSNNYLNRWIKMPKEKMPNFYNSIDIFLFPTNRSAESLGLVGLEAMSCGVPVIGTDDFALKEYIISGKTGERFNMNDYSEFERAIIKCIENLYKYKPSYLIKKYYSKESIVENYKEYFFKKDEG